jgi:hypothetical protein
LEIPYTTLFNEPTACLPFLPVCAKLSWLKEEMLEKCLSANNLAVCFEVELNKTVKISDI